MAKQESLATRETELRYAKALLEQQLAELEVLKADVRAKGKIVKQTEEKRAVLIDKALLYEIANLFGFDKIGDAIRHLHRQAQQFSGVRAKRTYLEDIVYELDASSDGVVRVRTRDRYDNEDTLSAILKD